MSWCSVPVIRYAARHQKLLVSFLGSRAAVSKAERARSCQKQHEGGQVRWQQSDGSRDCPACRQGARPPPPPPQPPPPQPPPPPLAARGLAIAEGAVAGGDAAGIRELSRRGAAAFPPGMWSPLPQKGMTRRQLVRKMSELGKRFQWQDSLVLFTGIEKPDLKTANAVIIACGRALQWEAALTMLRRMPKLLSVKPDDKSFNATMTACDRRQHWQLTLVLFDEMSATAVEPTIITYTAAITACGQGMLWRAALQLLSTLPAAAPPMAEADGGDASIAFSAAVSVLEKSHQWQRALNVLRHMESVGPQPNVISYNASITACEKGEAWPQALDLFAAVVRNPRVKPTAITFNAAIAALGVGMQWQAVLQLLRDMPTFKVQPTDASYSTTMAALFRGGRWPLAVQVLSDLEASSVRPALSAYNSGLAACEKGSNWQSAVRLLSRLLSSSREQSTFRSEQPEQRPNAISFNATLSCCVKGEQWELALRLLDTMAEVKVLPTDVTRNLKVKAYAAGGLTTEATVVAALRQSMEKA
eukprot:TRINITY_DN26295_c0_g2_i2.p1 TRINITY_DN26295_c0_g2~~TRINITY_DN26295_c0_g2_i2.p1  ORF type:complete len:561 (+),score=106.42 TRINITY_DN26295_c0_g2_i2:95-1684(+)